MELNKCYWKLVKNYFLLPIVFSVVGLVYGAIFNFILSGDEIVYKGVEDCKR